MNKFRRDILKVTEPRKHDVKNSYGVYDAYKWIRKHKWLNIGQPITEHDFYAIIRGINMLLIHRLMIRGKIDIPCNMGILELRKNKPIIKFKEGKIHTTLPIDWDRTLNLWAEDKESFDNKTLVRMESKEIFSVYYNKRNAKYKNKSFYEFNVNRDVKKLLKKLIEDNAIDAYIHG